MYFSVKYIRIIREEGKVARVRKVAGNAINMVEVESARAVDADGDDDANGDGDAGAMAGSPLLTRENTTGSAGSTNRFQDGAGGPGGRATQGPVQGVGAPLASGRISAVDVELNELLDGVSEAGESEPGAVDTSSI